MNTAPSPTCSLTTLAIIAPDGSRRVLGHVFKHVNPIIEAIVGTPLRWHLDFNTHRHNKRMEKLTTLAR